MLYYQLSVVTKNIADDKKFQNFITFVILVAGAMVGLQTNKELEKENEGLFRLIDGAILNIFIVEIVVKVVAEDSFPLRFFKSGWNCFDFLIVVGSLALAGGKRERERERERERLWVGDPRAKTNANTLLFCLPFQPPAA